MYMIGLINPSSKLKNYQGLSKLSAIMPPHWLAVRASYHRAQGREVKVVDCAIDDLNPESFADCRAIEIMPAGVEPSAFIHEQAGLESVITAVEPLGKPIEVITSLDFDPLQYPPAWDLFDLNEYYCHNWHGWGRPARNPYGTLATSISCPHKCGFCTISKYYKSKYKQQPMHVVEHDLQGLYTRGVRNIKMMDELFITTEKRIFEFCNMIIEGDFRDLNIYGYARIDGLLRLAHLNGWRKSFSDMKEAGINWICIGIESGNREIRKKYGKGDATNEEIIELVGIMQRAGINVLGNFMFGFPEDTEDTMQETTDLALMLNCEYSNLYCMVPYPGTAMEAYAKEQAWKLPGTYSGYAQYSYDFQPLPTHSLAAKEVLMHRDMSWTECHANYDYLKMMKLKFGLNVLNDIFDMTKHTLKRKLFDE